MAYILSLRLIQDTDARHIVVQNPCKALIFNDLKFQLDGKKLARESEFVALSVANTTYTSYSPAGQVSESVIIFGSVCSS